MAKYAVIQFTVTDEAGNVRPLADVEIRSHLTGNPLVSLFQTRTGTAKNNPDAADADGFFRAYAPPGAYRVTASWGPEPTDQRVWEHVAVGTAAEYDADNLLFSYPMGWGASQTLGDGEELPPHDVPLPMYLPAGLPNSYARLRTGPAAELVVSLKKNGVEFGTATFAIGATNATLVCAADVELVSGDQVWPAFPNPRDNLAADFSCTLLARK